MGLQSPLSKEPLRRKQLFCKHFSLLVKFSFQNAVHTFFTIKSVEWAVNSIQSYSAVTQTMGHSECTAGRYSADYNDLSQYQSLSSIKSSGKVKL